MHWRGRLTPYSPGSVYVEVHALILTLIRGCSEITKMSVKQRRHIVGLLNANRKIGGNLNKIIQSAQKNSHAKSPRRPRNSPSSVPLTISDRHSLVNRQGHLVGERRSNC